MRVCTRAQREDLVCPSLAVSDFLVRGNNMAMQ
jgi:hypothetical protein